MHASSRFGAVPISLVALAAMVGCGGSYDTPEATFQTMRVAANNKDMRGMFGCITDESLEMMAGTLVLAVKTPMGITAMTQSLSADEAKQARDAVEAVCENHGVTDDAVKEKTANPLALFTPDGIRGLSSVVDDKAAFVADMWNALQPFGNLSNLSEEFTAQLSGELKNVSINGEQATATIVMKNGEAPLEFRKTPAGWKVHWLIDPMTATAPPA